jgi:hypothetical protein
VIGRGRQTDQEFCFGGRRHEQLDDTLADDRVLAEQGGEFAQKPFRARRPMIFSAIRKRVDDLAYGLGDLVCPLLVEKPHDTNSPHSRRAPAAPTPSQLETSVAGPPSATAPCLKVDRCDIFAK